MAKEHILPRSRASVGYHRANSKGIDIDAKSSRKAAADFLATDLGKGVDIHGVDINILINGE
ncbi:unnamed protein product [Clonostachys byssicola]|uniref:Uncharacterized protein n=1 Tax=Clonostachys byssicola TaxID=160290 RepID=A0A9N9UDP2_9HYPO|nr:unnamed protein product [Clonostachys byssicola]